MGALAFQIKAFFVAIFIGIILAFFFLVHENFCQEFKIKYKLLFVLDVFYWILAAIFTFSALEITVEGRVRWFVFLGMALGWRFFSASKGYILGLKGKIKLDDRKNR